MKNQTDVYSEKSIESYQGLDGIRKRMAMYIGQPDSHGLWTTTRELLDNCSDEAQAGRNKSAHLILDTDGSYWVVDQGEGIPTGTITIKAHGTTLKMSALQAVVSELHTGGKFSTSGGAYSAGSVGCFTGDVKIRLLDGKKVSFANLYTRWQTNKSPIPIMSWDIKNDKVAYSNISHVQLSKYTKDIVKVALSNGKTIQCTPDHPFYIRTSKGIKKVKAEHLKSGASCVAMHLKSDSDGYLFNSKLRLNKSDNGPGMLHRSVANFYSESGIPTNYQVHHSDSIRINNVPTNLEIITPRLHAEEHSDERAEFSRTWIENNPWFKVFASEHLTLLNADDATNRIRIQTKSLNSGVRALLHFDGELTEDTYNSSRMYAAPNWMNLKYYFGSAKDFVKQCSDLLEYASKNRKMYKTSNDYLNWVSGTENSGDCQRANSAQASQNAALSSYVRAVLKSGLDIPSMTPSEFNAIRKGVGVLGGYACLCKWTTLKHLKNHILTGDTLVLHEDLSEDAQLHRAYHAEAGMRSCTTKTKILHLFVLASRKLDVINEFNYEEHKSKSTPNWKLATAILYRDYGISTLSEILDFIDSYNFSVTSITKVKLAEPVAVYGITVDDHHVYFVEPGVLVANTHGIGIKATNATSKLFEVWTRREGKIWNLSYADAKLKSEAAILKSGPRLPHGIVVKNWGTIFHVVPDLKLFEKGSKLQFSDVMQWAKVTSYLNAGFHINITGPNGKTREFYAENGVADYMAEQVADLKATELGDHFLYASKEMDVAISFTDCEGMQLHGYTNGLHNPAGGLHVQNVLKAFSAVVNTYRMSKHEFKPSDLYEGLVGIVNFKIAAPAFNNQVKEKLIDERVVAPSYEQTVEALTTWFKKHKDLARILCDRATELRNLNDEFANNKKLQRELKGVRGRSALPPKLSVARCEPGQRELFLVEGDSAGGSGSKARDSNYQELLPLRGKVLNAYKVKTTDLLWSNNEILNILKSIGFNPEVKDKLAALRVGKIILLGDADKDGFHINLLNLGLLCRVIPEIFEAGMVYVAKGFEYMIDTDKQNYYGNSVTEIKEAAPANLHKSIQHLKGWAECSARGLKHMAFDPETRVLQHVQIGPDCLSRVKGLLGHDTDVRKTLIETN